MKEECDQLSAGESKTTSSGIGDCHSATNYKAGEVSYNDAPSARLVAQLTARSVTRPMKKADVMPSSLQDVISFQSFQYSRCYSLTCRPSHRNSCYVHNDTISFWAIVVHSGSERILVSPENDTVRTARWCSPPHACSCTNQAKSRLRTCHQ